MILESNHQFEPNKVKTDALLGRAYHAQYADGSSEELSLRQLPLRDYPAALRLLDDEIALTALLAGRDRAWAERLTPASYEALYAVTKELNANGFFAWSARQLERQRAEQARALEALAVLPPDALEAAYKLGVANTSPTSSPMQLRRPV